MIKNVTGDGIVQLYKMDQYGGVDLSVSVSPPFSDNLRWLSDFRRQYETEQKLREENQAVKNAWEQYQVIKTLAQKETV